MDESDTLPLEGAPPAEVPVPVPEVGSEALGVWVSGSAYDRQRIEIRPGALEAIFRTDERLQAEALLKHCLAVLHPKEAGSGDDLNDHRLFMFSIVNDIGARDAVERMLAVQMAATHVAMIRAGSWLAKASDLPRVEAYSRAYNKLARTYATQMEALRKHRNGGQQKVRVEHVHVHPGGQAIVGEIHHGGSGLKMKDDVNPLSSSWEAGLAAMSRAPRCAAQSKRTGLPCQAPAASGWQVCYHHGAGGGHQAGRAHPSWKHGVRSQGAVELRRLANELAREARNIEGLLANRSADEARRA